MPTQNHELHRCRSHVPAIFLIGLGLGSAGAACPLSGKGSEKSPYLVGSMADLQQIPVNCGDSAVFRLTADLDAKDSTLPISSPPAESVYPGTGFRGAFHGAGHVIRNLSVQVNPSGSLRYSGLFWQLESSALVDSLGLPNIQIHGFRMGRTTCNITCSTLLQVPNGVGGISGHNLGQIRNCFVSGRFFYLGDTSISYPSTTISQTYGPGIAGGIAGVNAGTISNSYAILNGNTSVLTSTSAGSTSFDPIAREEAGIRIWNCYWVVRSPGGVNYGYRDQAGTSNSLTLDQMKHAANFHGFSFAPDSAWTIVEGSSFPLLRGLTNAMEATNATVSVRERNSNASGTQLLVRNGQFLLQLERPARVRIVDVQGNARTPAQELGAGTHQLAHPASMGLFLVQVRDEAGSTTFRWSPLH